MRINLKHGVSVMVLTLFVFLALGSGTFDAFLSSDAESVMSQQNGHSSSDIPVVEEYESENPTQNRLKLHDSIFDATRDVNSYSEAWFSLARYARNPDSMPEYLKLVVELFNTYEESFQYINTFGTCWSDGTIDWGITETGPCPDEKSVIEKLLAYRNSQLAKIIADGESHRTPENSEMLDAAIREGKELIEAVNKRIALGLAKNIVIAATDYLNFVIAVSNAESAYYDETARDRLSFDNGQVRVITREEQLAFASVYSSVKNENYKALVSTLLTGSQKLLDTLGSDLLLPVPLK
ncbi:MAG: hypothetical protein LBR16_05490 [Treponema sp.]|jgi:hypothetical protein|nr:hypothetical protein [Treponema sp.]